MFRQLAARTIGRIYDAHALQLLDRDRHGYMPWTSSAVRPGTVACILNDIVINRRKTIIEFGCGVSTVLISRCLDPAVHKLISIEHDEQWAESLARTICDAGLSPVCKVVCAPLKPCEHSLDGSEWYDTEVVGKALSTERVDTVLCDGPLADSAGARLSRYPAVPVVSDYLGAEYSIYLDDIQRRGERRIARRWGKLLNIRFRHHLLRGSFALGTQGRHLNALI